MSDIPPVDEWSGISGHILDRTSKPIETKNITTKSYEPLLNFIDTKVAEKTNTPAYLAEESDVDRTFDQLNKEEVEGLRDALKQVKGSSDLDLLKRDTSEIMMRGGQVGGLTRELAGRIIKVRNFLAFDEMVDFTSTMKDHGPSYDKAFESALDQKGISKEQLAQTFLYAYNSPSYDRIKGGNIPPERAKREDDETYTLLKYAANKIQPELNALKNARMESKKTKESIPELETNPDDYDQLYNFIYSGGELRDAVENRTATPAQVLELAERYTRAVQSEEYGQKLNIDTSRPGQQEVQDIRNGYDVLNRYLFENINVLKNQNLSQLKEAYDQAVRSGWLRDIEEDAERSDLNRRSRTQILSWFETLQTVFEPPQKPRFRSPIHR